MADAPSSSDQFAVARHPRIPALTATDVLRSGIRGYDAATGAAIGGCAVKCFEGRSPTTGVPMGSGWLLQLNAGVAFLADNKGAIKLFEATKTEVLGLTMKSVRCVVDPLTLERELQSRLANLIAIPFVDIVQCTDGVYKSFFTQSPYVTFGSEDVHGSRRDFTFQSGKDDLTIGAAVAAVYRWEQEFQSLALQVVAAILGGDAFWTRMRERVRVLGYRTAAVDPSLTSANLLRTNKAMPRVIDGPPEALKAIEDETCAQLEAAGYSHVRVLAALILCENGWDAVTETDDVVKPYARNDALDDRRFAAALRELWQPTFPAFHAYFSAQPNRFLALLSMSPESVELAAQANP